MGCVLALVVYIVKMRRERVLKREVSFARREKRTGDEKVLKGNGNSSNGVGLDEDDTDEQSTSLHLDDTPGNDGVAMNDDEFVIDAAELEVVTPRGTVAIADGETDSDDIDMVENFDDC